MGPHNFLDIAQGDVSYTLSNRRRKVRLVPCITENIIHRKTILEAKQLDAGVTQKLSGTHSQKFVLLVYRTGSVACGCKPLL